MCCWISADLCCWISADLGPFPLTSVLTWVEGTVVMEGVWRHSGDGGWVESAC